MSKHSVVRSMALALGLAALPLQAVAAEAGGCLAPAEVRALTAFALPSVLSGVIANCSPQVGAGSFMAAQGPALISAYAARKDASWPAARKAFFRLADEGKAPDKDTAQALATMPDAALQPFVEGMISSMVGAKLKPAECATADKLMRLLAPLPPENTAELVGTIIELADSDNKPGPGGLKLCK